jgi:hypothetical protein
MFVAATAVLPFGWFLVRFKDACVLLVVELPSLEMPADGAGARGAGEAR